MNRLDSHPDSNANPPAAVEIQSSIEARLKALQNNQVAGDLDHSFNRRWRIGLIAAGSALGVLVIVFFVMTAIRLHGPNATVLNDGWTRVVDRQWGFQVDFPTWHTKSSDGPQAVRYVSRFANYTEVRLRVRNWKDSKTKPSTAANELDSILKSERQLRPVKVLLDRSTDPTSPMIDFISTCGQPGYQWTVRERVMIHKDVMIRIDIVRPDGALPEDLDRFLNSVRWLQK